jgi:hypothetical protein
MKKYPDLVAVGDLFVVTPVHHFIRSISLTEIGEKKTLMGTWGIQILWSLENSARIWNFIRPGFRVEPLGIGALAIEKLAPVQKEIYFEEIDKTTLPFLRNILTISGLLPVVSDPVNPCGDDAYVRFYVELAAGNFDKALEIFNLHRGEWLHSKDYYWSSGEIMEDLRLRKLGQLLEADASARIGELLRKWEARAVRRAGVDHLWEPTPFPFETST